MIKPIRLVMYRSDLISKSQCYMYLYGDEDANWQLVPQPHHRLQLDHVAGSCLFARRLKQYRLLARLRLQKDNQANCTA